MLKLYMHPVSNTSRPVLLYIAENRLPVEQIVVDLMTGEHHKEPYISVNPNRLVPTLIDDDLVLTESSAILKYLADKYDSPDYPKDLKTRAKVNEIMDWFNTNFYRDFGYGVVYPQIYPHHKRPNDEIQTGTIKWAQELTRKWLQVLDDHWLKGGRNYLVGEKLTIADYFGAGLITTGDVIGCDFKAYPNIEHWLHGVRNMKSWNKVNETMNGFREMLKDKSFETL